MADIRNAIINWAVEHGLRQFSQAFEALRQDRDEFLAAEEGLRGPDYDGAIIPYRAGQGASVDSDEGDWFTHVDNFLKHPIAKKLLKHGIKHVAKKLTEGDKKTEKPKAISDSASNPTSTIPAGKRKILPVENMPGGGATDNDVAVVPPPRKIAKSHPDYFTINLPFHFNDVLKLSGTSIPFGQIRLDSVYDPIAEAAGMPRKAHQPMGRDTWSNIYDYYRVLSCDVKLTFTYLHGVFGDGTNSVDVPQHALVGFTLVDDASATPANANAFVEMKHTVVDQLHPTNIQRYLVAAGDVETTQLHTFGGHVGAHHHFVPSDWDLHVTQAGADDRWTGAGASPTNNRWLVYTAMYPNNDEGLGGNDQITIAVDGYLTYTVQWREYNTTKKKTIDTTQT